VLPPFAGTSERPIGTRLSEAIKPAFTCVEIAGRLRDVEPNRANEVANTSRDRGVCYAVRRHEVV
jgi:hypothetical protein